MPDREKVIKGLELCTNISPDGCLMLCPYKDEKDETYSGFCEQVLKQDVLALLNEQEADKTKYEYKYDHTDCPWYGSGNCPSTCSQYRDGWNDAMDYIFKDGKGYQPYRRLVKRE